MGRFSLGRRRGKRSDGTLRTGDTADTRHLEQFIASRQGVEAFVEPRTTVTDTTILLVAHDGEWTRRRVDGPAGAASFAKKQAIPLYDATVVGYPQRMRDYNARQKDR
ncbi:oxidoreductase [Jatrophihabitans sp. DSM 45814]